MSNLRLNKFKCPFPRSLRQPEQRRDLECGFSDFILFYFLTWTGILKFSDFKTMISLHWASLFLKLRLTSEMRTDTREFYDGSLTWGPAIPGGPGRPLGPASPCSRKNGEKKRKNSRNKCLDPTYGIVSKMSTSISFTHFPWDSQVPACPSECLSKGRRW